MSEALSFNNISFRYDDEQVVNNVSFAIAQGEVVCLLGPSGCGKTTCLRLAAGMEQPQEGTISLNGEVVSSADVLTPPEARHIGFLFQEFALFPHLSVNALARFYQINRAKHAGHINAGRLPINRFRIVDL